MKMLNNLKLAFGGVVFATLAACGGAGLAKKNNGCMPPGQARKWAVGQPLPRDVVYYSVPQSSIIQLGAPPPAHRYVRVASDILLIANGTGLIVDAIQDLGRI